jgi:hypothetical protein
MSSPGVAYVSPDAANLGQFGTVPLDVIVFMIEWGMGNRFSGIVHRRSACPFAILGASGNHHSATHE